METRKAMEELKKENQLKILECQEAWTSLNDLQNELMRKSMHVGSLGKEFILVNNFIFMSFLNQIVRETFFSPDFSYSFRYRRTGEGEG